MDNSNHSALCNRILDLSFQTLNLQSGGHSEVKDVLSIIQQLLNVETVGIFFWDSELNALYPLGTCGSKRDLLCRHVNENSALVWEESTQNIDCLAARKTDSLRANIDMPLYFPLLGKHSKLGILGFLNALQINYVSLQETISCVTNFILCVDSARKNRVLKKKSDDLEHTKSNLESLLKQNATIQERLEEMAAELKLTAEKAEKANRAKSEFLSSMSHELRTPMHGILGFAEILAMDDLSDSQRKKVERIRQSSEHLMRMINDLLDLSRIEAGRIDITKSNISLANFIRECIDLIQPLADKNSIIIENQILDTTKQVFADKQKLKQVILNLLSNAIKYNRDKGSITIHCEANGENRLKINVIDTGRGIPADKLAQIFEKFERLHERDSIIEGTGIGLAICKKMIEGMDGDIGVNSVVSVGSCFWVQLPSSI